jgi:hypothetical protein
MVRRIVLPTLNRLLVQLLCIRRDGAVGTVHTVQTASEARSHAPALVMPMNPLMLDWNLPALAVFRAV